MEMLRAEVARLFAFDIHYPNKAVFRNQRNRKFGTDRGVGGDLEVGSGSIVEQHALPGEDNLADGAFADGYGRAFDLGRVADLKAHAQLVGAVVDKEDG